ncbi:MAG: tRNA lysidine(34) synthetase TilS [Enterobacterales bacterium]|nr:tRNA lysidine(34) synthetase TilS [Enterobacterales bacterium]
MMDPFEACLHQQLLSLVQNQALDALQLTPQSASQPLLVAYSGGLDSSVLLHAVVSLWQQGLIDEPIALHFNHGLQAQALDWQKHCQSICQAYKIQFICQQAALSKENKTSEQDARQARYQFFESLIAPDQLLLMAHHQNDQAETLLFRLIRGSGRLGMSGIQPLRRLAAGSLMRPMLHLSKSDIHDYAIKHELSWIEDPSNQSVQYDRNYIRQQLLPLVEQRWHKATKNIAQFSQIAGEQNEILQQAAEQDLAMVASGERKLSYPKLIKLSAARQKNLLHYWVNQMLGQSPSYAEIMQLLKQLESVALSSNTSNQAIKVKLASGWIRLFKQELYFCLSDPPQALAESIVWRPMNKRIILSKDLALVAHPLDLAVTSADVLHLTVRPPKKDEIVSLRARIGGEKIQPAGQDFRRSLKKLFQDLAIPHWDREWLPIVYYNDQIVAIPGVVVDQTFFSQQPDAIYFNLESKHYLF